MRYYLHKCPFRAPNFTFLLHVCFISLFLLLILVYLSRLTCILHSTVTEILSYIHKKIKSCKQR